MPWNEVSWFSLAQILAFVVCVIVTACAGCGDLSDCSVEEVPICALDKKNVCFKHFASKCHMQHEACIKEREYLIYIEAYCEMNTFMCEHEFKKYAANWNEHENLDKVIFSIYQKKRK